MTAIDTSTEAVERLLDGVTPGPWRIKDCATVGYRCTSYYQEIWNDQTDILVTTEVTRAHNDGGAANMRFIRTARDLVPALLKERDEARALVAAAISRAEYHADSNTTAADVFRDISALAKIKGTDHE